MNRGELYQQVHDLAELNVKANPIAASVLYTLAGLIAMNEEIRLAVYANEINGIMLNKIKDIQNEN